MDIIVQDVEHLLLEKAIVYGLKNSIFEESFIEGLCEELSAITVRLASEFYNAHYEAYLRQSMDIAMGICNFGAILWSEEDVQKTAFLLREEGLVKLFRKGFTMVKKMAQETTSFRNNFEKLTVVDLSKRMMAEEGVAWTGYKYYLDLKNKIQDNEQYFEFLDWFACKYTGNVSNVEKKEKNLQTGLLSMSVHNAPIKALNLNTLKKIITMELDEILRMIELFISTEIPKHFQVHANKMCSEIMHLVKGAQEKSDITFLAVEFNSAVATDDLVRLQAKAFDVSEKMAKEQLNAEEAIKGGYWMEDLDFSGS